MRGEGAAPSLSASAGLCPVFNCPAHVAFLPALAAAVASGRILSGARAPHELPEISVYLPTHASLEPFKLALLAQAPNATNPRAYSPGPPVAGFGGIRITF